MWREHRIYTLAALARKRPSLTEASYTRSPALCAAIAEKSQLVWTPVLTLGSAVHDSRITQIFAELRLTSRTR